jgi:ribonuclease P/MRP protein subunit POP1
MASGHHQFSLIQRSPLLPNIYEQKWEEFECETIAFFMALATAVKPVDLAKERDPQISSILQNIENSRPSHKRLFQRLPNHLRRRAMSYDIRRVPKSMRTEAIISQTEAAATVKQRNKPHGRDSNRFRPHGINQSAHRNEHWRWLETHLWHAKRFHMQEMWGWKIPMTPTMKQTRALIRMSADNCTFRDVSYFVAIALHAPHEELFDKLVRMVRPNSPVEESLHFLSHADFFKPLAFPTSPIGPVDIFWHDRDALWIICHPLLKDAILESVGDELNPEVIESELVMFEILGPNSTQVVRDVLRPIPETDVSLFELVASLPCPAALPPGFSIAYMASDQLLTS